MSISFKWQLEKMFHLSRFEEWANNEKEDLQKILLNPDKPEWLSVEEWKKLQEELPTGSSVDMIDIEKFVRIQDILKEEKKKEVSKKQTPVAFDLTKATAVIEAVLESLPEALGVLEDIASNIVPVLIENGDIKKILDEPVKGLERYLEGVFSGNKKIEEVVDDFIKSHPKKSVNVLRNVRKLKRLFK